ncbi:MAG: respiratory nitrate reductase subunit gamma, partial [Candidatus Eremiobacteraeota bacterium]|nr:respiratory nitrate reductase subunit gamma [Candidatus Eremiobacteraeota bacterium]
MSNTFTWVVYPYVAFAIFVSVGLYRYFNDRFSFSTQSSQFLENRLSFWGSTMWHYGIILILIPHTLAFWFPKAWGLLISDPTRLYVMEITGLGLAIMAIIGLGILIVRRVVNVRANSVTT